MTRSNKKLFNIGDVVKFKWYKYYRNKNGIFECKDIILTGIINKRMFPGYEYKNTDSTQLRYGITDINDKNHSWVINHYKLIY